MHMFCADYTTVTTGETWAGMGCCPLSHMPGGCLLKPMKVWGSDTILQDFEPPRSSPWLWVTLPRKSHLAIASRFTPSLAQRKHLWKEERFKRSFPSSMELYSHCLSPSLCLPSSALLSLAPWQMFGWEFPNRGSLHLSWPLLHSHPTAPWHKGFSLDSLSILFCFNIFLFF